MEQSTPASRLPRHSPDPGFASEHFDAEDRWARFINRHLCTFSARACRDQGFEVTATARSGDGFCLARFTTFAGSARMVRGAREISADPLDSYVFYVPFKGDYELTQFGRTARHSVEQMAFVSMAEPVTYSKLGNNDACYLFLPRTFVDQRLQRPEDRCGRLVSASGGLCQVVRDSLTSFQLRMTEMSDGEFRATARALGELVLHALCGSNDPAPELKSVRAANLARVKRVIRARSCEPELTLADIAKSCGLSLRYLHALFQDEGDTAWEYVKRERLRRAHHLLSNCDPARSTVIGIAMSCGFSNASQFSTAFRRAYSLTPREVMRRR